jgi:Fe-S cluster assembly iron-binding protein IscA
MLIVTDTAAVRVKEVLSNPENKDQFVRVYFDGIG